MVAALPSNEFRNSNNHHGNAATLKVVIGTANPVITFSLKNENQWILDEPKT